MGGLMTRSRTQLVQEYEEEVEASRQRAAQAKLANELKKLKKARLVEAVTMAANHVYQYAPITVQTREVDDPNPVLRGFSGRWADPTAALGAGQGRGGSDGSVTPVRRVSVASGSVRSASDEVAALASDSGDGTYIWVIVDEAMLDDDELLLQYPAGVAVNNDGDMFVPAYATYPARSIRYKDLPFSFLPPDQPRPPRLGEATSTTLRVVWDAGHSMADKYEVQFFPLVSDRCGAQIWRTTSNAITGLEYTLTDLPFNTPFKLRMRTHNPFGWSPFSGHVHVATTPAPPEPLRACPVAEVLSDGVVVVQWVECHECNGSPVLEYHLRGKVVGPDSTYETLHRGPELSCDLAELKPGSMYHFQVAVVNAFGESEFSEAVTAETPMQHRTLGDRVVPENALRVMGDWIECWDEENSRCYYLHLKTGVKRKQPPPERPSTPTRPTTPILIGKPGDGARSPSSTPRSMSGRLRSHSRPGSFSGSPRPMSPALRSRLSAKGVSPLHLRSLRGRAGSAGSMDEAKFTMSPGRVGDSPQTLFRKKRYRFLCGLRRRSATMRPGTPSLGSTSTGVLFLPLDRTDVFQDSFDTIRRLTPGELTKKLRIDYRGEEGIDAGGLTKDWYLQLSRELFKPERRLFKEVEGERVMYTIHPRARVNPEHAAYFRFVGRLIAKAIWDVQLVDLPLCTLLYKQLLGQKVGFEDLKEMDEVFGRSLEWMLENDITDIVHETFSVMEEDERGRPVEIELKPGGADIEVTQANKAEFVSMVVEYRTAISIQGPLEALRAGFYEVVPWESVRVFSVDELELLLNGKPEIDVDDLKRNVAHKGGLTASSKVVVWFWDVMETFDQEMRGKVLRFTTGTSRVPLDGYDPALTFTAASDLGPDALPKAHTCFNQLVLPAYPDKSTLCEKLAYAANHGEGFLLG